MRRTNFFFLLFFVFRLLFSMEVQAKREIIFTTANVDIVIMDEDGKNRRLLVTRPWQIARFSPIATDGKNLVAFTAGPYIAYAVDINTHKVKELIPNPPNNSSRDVHWSPNGTRVIFTSGQPFTGPSPELYVADANGLSPVLVDKGAWIIDPTWIDNDRISYAKVEKRLGILLSGISFP